MFYDLTLFSMGYFKTLRYGGALCPPPPPLTLLFLKVEEKKFGSMGYFDVPSSKMALIFKFRASMTS